MHVLLNISQLLSWYFFQTFRNLTLFNRPIALIESICWRLQGLLILWVYVPQRRSSDPLIPDKSCWILLKASLKMVIAVSVRYISFTFRGDLRCFEANMNSRLTGKEQSVLIKIHVVSNAWNKVEISIYSYDTYPHRTRYRGEIACLSYFAQLCERF